MINFGSVFSGIGGFDLGFENAGLTCAWQAENDLKASTVLAKHWPHVQNFGDIRNVGKDTAEAVDVICGGFPCQDVSVAGKRAGLAGKRSGLWFEFARVIDELEPRWIVIENVPGLLSSNKGRDFALVVRWLAERGYGVAWRVLDAQYFGVPQRRRRVFIVGSLGDGRAAEVLFESKSGEGDFTQSGKAGKDTAFSLRANPSRSGDKGDGGINTNMVSGTLPASGAGLNRPAGQGNELDFIVADTLTSMYARNRGTSAGYSSKTQNLIATALTAHPTGRGHAMTTQQAAESNQLLGTLRFVRRLTPTECERLQGFPDGWTEGQSDSARYRQLGNAVAVPVAEWIGRRIPE